MLDATTSAVRAKIGASAARLAGVADEIADAARQAIRDAASAFGAGHAPRLVPVPVRVRDHRRTR